MLDVFLHSPGGPTTNQCRDIRKIISEELKCEVDQISLSWVKILIGGNVRVDINCDHRLDKDWEICKKIKARFISDDLMLGGQNIVVYMHFNIST